MAGLAPISLQQRCGIDGRPFPGARAYFYEASTLTPIVTYQDYGLGTPHPFPVVANEYGVFPAIFLDEADEFYRLMITKSDGGMLTDLITLPIIGPTGGGGGSETPVDPNSLLKTGDPLWVPNSGARAGFVRMNGRTIGSAVSGATERANLDCETLYLFNWTNFSNAFCPVAGGRGVSAAADWAADKTIGLLDMRGRGSLGLDTMGSTSSGLFTGIPFDGSGTATTAGSSGGEARHTLTIANMPSHDHNGSTGTSGAHTHTYNEPGSRASAQSGAGANPINNGTPANTSPDGDHTHTIPAQGGGGAHNNMHPFMLGTWYQKL